MIQADGVAKLVEGLLDGPLIKETVVRGKMVKGRVKTAVRDEGGSLLQNGDPEDEVEVPGVKIRFGDPEFQA